MRLSQSCRGLLRLLVEGDDTVPKSQFITPDRLKRLLIFVAVAFIVLLAVAPRIVDAEIRTGFIVGWMIVFPVGCWRVLRVSDGT